MGADKPRKVSASGGRFMLKDAGEMPDLMQVTYEYPGFLMHYEACNFNSHGLGGRTPGMKYYHGTGADNRPHGMAFYGSKGALFADRLGYEIYPEPKSSLERKSMNTTDATSTHAKRFVDVIRNSVALNAPAEVGHRAAIIGHLGNIALKTGRTLEWNAETEKFVNDAEANRMLGRTGRKQWDFARVIG
jgi:hypothetical protein